MWCTLNVANISRDTPLKKTNLPFAEGCQLEIVSLLGMGANLSLCRLCKKGDIDLGGLWGEKPLGGVVEEGNSDQNILFKNYFFKKLIGNMIIRPHETVKNVVDDFQAGVVALILAFS